MRCVLHFCLISFVYLLHSTEFSFGILDRNDTMDNAIDASAGTLPEPNDRRAISVSDWQTIDGTEASDRKVEIAGDPVLAMGKKLSRKKRYLAFPLGSSFSMAFCETVGFVGNPQYIYFSWGLNWGLAYELPNQTWIINDMNRHKKRLPKPIIQRRHRRELYGRLEVAIDNMGYSGRACILRALCESPQYFYSRGSNMVEELLRTTFSLPESNVLPFEHADLMEYDAAHRTGKNHTHCPFVFPDCSISLIELALGTYSNQ